MTRIENLSDAELIARADAAADAGDWEPMERCEAVLERRDYDESDPACVSGVEDGAGHVVSDAELECPGF